MPPEKPQPLPLGTILDGKFRVTKEIGRGGMAAVFEAENVDIGKRVAVKILAQELITSRVVTERFIREARASAAVRSPYICDVYDVGTYEDRPFLVMELLEGESLYDRLSRVRRLDPEQTLRIARQTAKGLSKAHAANIVHRDLKPENIFLTKNEDGEIVAKIVDFGLAKFYENEGGDAARLTKEGALFGTPAYMSPEQAKAQGEVDLRSDLWALACIVYECLTGRTVWNVDQGVAMILAQIAGAPIPRPSRVRPDLPSTFDDWFLRALDRDPDKRFQTAQEFARTLEAALLPPEGSIKRAPLNTEEEGLDVDRLVSGDVEPTAAPYPGLHPQSAHHTPSSGEVAAPLPSTLPPAAKGRGSGFAIGLLLALTGIVLAGYGVWFYVLNPPGDGAFSQSGDTRSDAASGEPRARLRPLETEPFALQVNQAQERLARGETTAAAELLQGAFESSKNNVARSLMTHAEVAMDDAGDSGCKLTGLGRPRPFSDTAPGSSLPTLTVSPAGVVVAWAETDPKTHKRQVYTTLLDDSLRRVAPTTAVTPEGQLVQQPELFSYGNGIVMSYWDNKAAEPGIFLRRLDRTGKIESPPRRIAPSERKQSYPATTSGSDGKLWLVWTEETSGRTSDLMAQKIGEDLSPASEPARLTAYTPPALRGDAIASKSQIVEAHGYLNIAYALQSGQEHHVFLLRVSEADPGLASGGLEAGSVDAAQDARDRFLGQVIPISMGPGKHNQPDIACVSSGCFVVWDDEKAGAHAAYVEADSGEVLWRREIGPKALRPAIASREDETLVAWYEDNQLHLAHLTRDRLEPASALAHASGYQPSPWLVPGKKTGDWYVSWRDFEAARHEAFVLRAECP